MIALAVISYPSSGRSSTRASPRYSSCNFPSSGRSFVSVRQVSLSGCFVILSLPHAYMNDLDIDLARNTPWVDMSACVKFCLDRPSRLAGHTEHRYKHNAFYLYRYTKKKKKQTTKIEVQQSAATTQRGFNG